MNLNQGKVLAGLHTIVARPKKNIFTPGFLGYLMSTENVRLQMMRFSHRSKVLELAQNILI